MTTQGLHSEIGRLRRVLVCRPGLAQQRLTPANCRDLLFDDVLWVEQARNDHDAFTNAMLSRDVEVLELHDLLATSMANPEARTWLLDRKLAQGTVDSELAQQLRPWLEALPPMRLAEHLIGGLARAELPDLDVSLRGAVSIARRVRAALRPSPPTTSATRGLPLGVKGRA